MKMSEISPIPRKRKIRIRQYTIDRVTLSDSANPSGMKELWQKPPDLAVYSSM